MDANHLRQFLLLLVFLVSYLAFPSSSVSLKRRKSLKIIEQVNKEGPRIGLIAVYTPEQKAFFDTGAFQPHPQYPFIDLSGRRFRVGKVKDKRVLYVTCGVGTMNAAAATQQMLDLFNIKGIVHFGVAANANSSMSIGDVTIPKQFVHTGIWDWLKPNATVSSSDIAQLDFGNYNVPRGEGNNLLGRIGYSYEEFFSESGKPNTPQHLVWAHTTSRWLHVAANLRSTELVQCVNASFCLPQKPKLVIGLRGSTSNVFVDNAAYRDFLFQTFHVSSIDMESSAVVMTSLSNGFPVIVIRGLSDLAGAQEGDNHIRIYGPLAAINAAKLVIQFLDVLNKMTKHCIYVCHLASLQIFPNPVSLIKLLNKANHPQYNVEFHQNENKLWDQSEQMHKYLCISMHMFCKTVGLIQMQKAD